MSQLKLRNEIKAEKREFSNESSLAHTELSATDSDRGYY